MPLLDAIPCIDQREEPVLNMILMFFDCLPPLLAEIVEFLAEDPEDLHQLLGTTHGVRNALDDYWPYLYSSRWPAFAEAARFEVVNVGFNDLHGNLCFHTEAAGTMTSWRDLYLATLRGEHECVLEVFDREKRNGFAMSAWPARIRFEATKNCYVAQYISAGTTRSERILCSEIHRLRLCPIRERLTPRTAKRARTAMLHSKEGSSMTVSSASDAEEFDTEEKFGPQSSGSSHGLPFVRQRANVICSTIRRAFVRPPVRIGQDNCRDAS